MVASNTSGISTTTSGRNHTTIVVSSCRRSFLPSSPLTFFGCLLFLLLLCLCNASPARAADIPQASSTSHSSILQSIHAPHQKLQLLAAVTGNSSSSSTGTAPVINSSTGTSEGKSDSDPGGLSVGAIIGISIGVICVFVAIGLAYYFYGRKWVQQQDNELAVRKLSTAENGSRYRPPSHQDNFDEL